MSYKELFIKELRPQLQKSLNIKNVMAVPKLKKIIINIGIGSYLKKNKDYNEIVKNISLISGQKPVVCYAKKAISNFKLRQGMPTGIKVTLRGTRMYDFFYKIIHVVFPRIRDFRGFSKKGFDKQGNYSIGLDDFTIFPEINLDDVVEGHGLQICIVTNAQNNTESEVLLKIFGFPFKKV